MQNTTPLFPGFHLQTLRKKPRSALQIMLDKTNELKQKSLSQLSDIVGQFIPDEQLRNHSSGKMSRHRIYSKENTFWGFFYQVMNPDSSCQNVVRKIQAYSAAKNQMVISSSTSAYCQARQRLDKSTLTAIQSTLACGVSNQHDSSMNNRRVIVVDGTGLSMPDTKANQAVWPQQSGQKQGCGFPQMKVCACFNLNTGLMHSYRIGNKHSAELPLLREQWGTLNEGDILLGDAGFMGYYDVSCLSKRGIDSIATMRIRKPISAQDSERVLGKDDLLVRWNKPPKYNIRYPLKEWEKLPDSIVMRQIKIEVAQQGFRKKSFYIVTTLLDEALYPAKVIADLYLKRWEVELFFRDIKTTMGMDILRCKTPAMVEKELLMHWIVYNCIRRLMLEAAYRHNGNVKRISFKASLQAVRQWEAHFNPKITANKRKCLIDLLYQSIASKIIPHRPERREPRAVKRRPKPFQLLNKSRNEMVEIQHRSRYAKHP